MTLTVNHLICCCVVHSPAAVNVVRFDSVVDSFDGIELSENKEPRESLFLSCNPESEVFTQPIFFAY